MNAKTRGKMWQNSPPPQESTSPPARSIASHKGSADRAKSSAVAASTSSMAHTSATISRREPAGRSASESRPMVKRYAFQLHPSSSAAILAWLPQTSWWTTVAHHPTRTRPPREPRCRDALPNSAISMIKSGSTSLRRSGASRAALSLGGPLARARRHRAASPQISRAYHRVQCRWACHPRSGVSGSRAPRQGRPCGPSRDRARDRRR